MREHKPPSLRAISQHVFIHALDSRQGRKLLNVRPVMQLSTLGQHVCCAPIFYRFC
jgi:hypothetical protein